MNDPYQEARAIADTLDGNGKHEYADQLRSALVEGATGTEIYMILRWRLANIANDTTITADVKKRMRLLQDYLDRTLAS
jgi:hypothetical protein